MAETEECAHRACFLIAEVTVIHSVVIRATGSTAIDIFVSSIAGESLCWSCCCAILGLGMGILMWPDGPVVG